MDPSSSLPIDFQKVVEEEQGPSGSTETSILLLNNDCLYHILSFLKPRELLRMENVCERFNDVTQKMYRKHHVLDFSEENSEDTPWSIEEVTKILCKVGRYIHTLKIDGSSKSLKLIDSTVIRDLIRQHCRNLQSFHLGGFTFRNRKSAENMAAMCENVKVARLRQGIICDDALITMLKLNQVEVLELFEVWLHYGEFLSLLTNIREISFEDCRYVYPELFVKFCKEHPNLRSLNVMGCHWINETCLQSIATYLTALEELALSIKYPTSYTLNHYVSLAAMRKIKHFAIESFAADETTKQLLLKFAAHDRLEYLKLEGVPMTTDIEEVLTKFTKLKVLNLNYCLNLNDSTLDLLSCTATLQQLHIDTYENLCSVTSSCLERLIARCPAIEFIDISAPNELDDSCIPTILDILKERPHMLELKVSRGTFSKETFGKYLGDNGYKLKLSYK